MILSPGVPVTQAVTKGTASIPVLATVPDLVASGFVESLARPGGNVTGISLQAGVALSEKWLELLKETFPHVRKVAVLAISPRSRRRAHPRNCQRGIQFWQSCDWN